VSPGSPATLASLLLLAAATYVLGSRYGTRVGVGAALVAASGALELLRMSYPASAPAADAFCVTALAAATGTTPRALLAASLAAAVALFLRPSGAAVALVIAVFLLYRPERPWRARLRSARLFAGGCAGGLLIAQLAPVPASGAGGIGLLLIGLSASVVVLIFLLLCLAAPFVVPGALTALLMAASIVDPVSRVFVDERGGAEVPSFALIALTSVLAMASVDAVWRRRRLPRPDVAVVAAAAVLVILEHV